MRNAKYGFDERIDRRGTDCSKWDNLRAVFGREDLLALWVADMDFRSAPEIVDALRKQVDFGVFGYPVMSAAAVDALVRWEAERHGWAVDPSLVGFVPGVVTGLALAVEAFTEPGDGVVVQTPVYPPFFRVIEDNGRRIVENPLRDAGDRYEMDLENLRRVLTPDVRALILCSPHNPVARVWSVEELRGLAALCLERNVAVFCDEIHQDLVYSDARHVPLAVAEPALAPLLLTLLAPSKTFNIAGLCASAWVAGNEAVAERMRGITERLHLSRLNMMAFAAFEAAYAKAGAWRDAVVEYLEGNRALVESFLAERMPRVRLKHPEGTYIFWLDFRDYGLDDEALQRLLLDEARVALNPGKSFGRQGDGFARLNVGCPRAQLQEGLERIAQALAAR